ncbi:hypothetical protein H2248_010134 [Termitomyces sp. 'cryptogamus']|nr:hypothetical protein H2248_010134 [Termitomyces sp. 'cryptogamus']
MHDVQLKTIARATGELIASNPVELEKPPVTSSSTKTLLKQTTIPTSIRQESETVKITTQTRTTATTDSSATTHIPIPTESPSTRLSPPPISSKFTGSTSSPLTSLPSVSTSTKLNLSTTSESTATIATAITPTHTSSSEHTERHKGSLLGEVLGSVFAFLILSSIFIASWIWCRRRRHRRELRNANPFISDEGYLQPISKQEEFQHERAADGTSGTRVIELTRQSVVALAMDQKLDLERGDSVNSLRAGTGTGKRMRAGTGKKKGARTRTRTGTRTGMEMGVETGTRMETGTGIRTGTVEEEVTMLRERLVALEDQHRELTGELRSAIIIPPQYSR